MMPGATAKMRPATDDPAKMGAESAAKVRANRNARGESKVESHSRIAREVIGVVVIIMGIA